MLSDLAVFQYEDAVGNARDNAEVVRDEEKSEAQIAPKLAQQVEHGGLDRDIESGCDLVAHEEVRVRRERSCDRHSLQLSARELTRKPSGETDGKPDAIENKHRLLARLLTRESPQETSGARDLLEYAPPRVERVRRVLEYDLDTAALLE